MSKRNNHLACQKYLFSPSSVLQFIAVNLITLHYFGKLQIVRIFTTYSCLLLMSSRRTALRLIPWSRFLHHKLTDLELVKNFMHFRVITSSTRALQLSPSWARSIQSMPPKFTYLKLILLASHLCLVLPSGLSPSCFPTKLRMHISCPTHVLYAPPILFFMLWSPD